MRELQALLKEKYYPDLITSFDYRSSVLTNINLRHKTNDLNFINPKSLIFLNYNLTTSTFLKTQTFDTGMLGGVISSLDNLSLRRYSPSYLILTLNTSASTSLTNIY